VNLPRLPSFRLVVPLPVGHIDPKTGAQATEAEVRPVVGGDEYAIGTALDYQRHPNDLVYKTLLMTRCVVRLGDKRTVTLDDIRNLHAQDMRAIEEAIYLITYGDGEGIDDEAEPTP
jgi:hypothetical protein